MRIRGRKSGCTTEYVLMSITFRCSHDLNTLSKGISNGIFGFCQGLAETCNRNRRVDQLRDFDPAPATLSSADSTNSLTAIREFGFRKVAIAPRNSPLTSCSIAAFFCNLTSVACETAVRSTSRWLYRFGIAMLLFSEGIADNETLLISRLMLGKAESVAERVKVAGGLRDETLSSVRTRSRVLRGFCRD